MEEKSLRSVVRISSNHPLFRLVSTTGTLWRLNDVTSFVSQKLLAKKIRCCRVVWGVSLPSCDRAGWRARFPSPPSHPNLLHTGASVNAWYDLYVSRGRRYSSRFDIRLYINHKKGMKPPASWKKHKPDTVKSLSITDLTQSLQKSQKEFLHRLTET